MTPDDAARLLTFLSGLDPTQMPATPEDVAVKATAWAATIVDAASLDFCREAAIRHYRVTPDHMTPHHFNAAWQRHSRQPSERLRSAPEAHCGRADCDCTHSGGCFKGWVDSDAGPTQPCGRCRPWTARRVADVPRPGHRSDGDLAHLRGEGVDRSTLDMTPHVYR